MSRLFKKINNIEESNRLLEERFFADKNLRFINEDDGEKRIKEITDNFSTLMAKAKNEHIANLNKPETRNKLRDPSKLNTVIPRFKKISLKVNRTNEGQSEDTKKAYGYVKTNNPDIFYLNVYMFKPSDDIKNIAEKQYSTMFHELGHSLEFMLKDVGEQAAVSDTVYVNQPSKEGQDVYVASSHENYTRMLQLRRILNLGPITTKEKLKNAILNAKKDGTLVLTQSKYMGSPDGKFLYFTVSPQTWNSIKKIAGKDLTDLWGFYTRFLKVRDESGNVVDDVSALFANYSKVLPFKEEKNVYEIVLDLEELAKLNNATVMNDNKPNDSFNPPQEPKA